jgi:FkbH-like protein
MGVTKLMGVVLAGWRFWQQRQAFPKQHLGSGAADAFTALSGDHRQSGAGGERYAPRAPKQPVPADTGDGPAEDTASHVDQIAFLAPGDLSRTAPEPLRLLAVGSCLLQDLFGEAGHDTNGVTVDFLLSGFSANMPSPPKAGADSYDCQVLQLALRPLLPDALLAELAAATPTRQEAIFRQSIAMMGRYFQAAIGSSLVPGLPTFVINFPQPQFNRMSRFTPRFSLGNLEYYVMRLNEELERLARGQPNCYVLDLDRIAASFGRRFVQDDLVLGTNHSARLKPHARVDGRMEPVGPVSNIYDVQPNGVMRAAVFAELRAMMRTIRQIDSVKLVAVDLDDTLWRGVSGDSSDIGPHMIEGYPMGLIEALHVLKARGILLAIVSKNDETRIRQIWGEIFGRRLKLDDFAAVRINWRPKRENMREILAAVNLLPRNVLFIDDNPAERAQMTAAFPDIRVLGGNPFVWRRILLLAPEMQVVSVTAESAQRTEMVQAQVQREAERATLTAEEFAQQQNVRLQLSLLRSVEDVRFARVLELINKTNQFNTTGVRWTADGCAAFLRDGGVFAVYDVQDRYTPYGLVGVVMVRAGEIQQWVMSCRVFGLGVEQAVMQALVTWLREQGAERVRAVLTTTDANQPCRGLFAAAGFHEIESGWVLDAGTPVAGSRFVSVEAALV